MAGIVRRIHPPIVAPDREPIMPGKVSSLVSTVVRRQNCTLCHSFPEGFLPSRERQCDGFGTCLRVLVSPQEVFPQCTDIS